MINKKKKVPRKDRPSQGNISISDTKIIPNSIKKVNTKVSLIVPAFNIEKYIVRCLNSVVDQTYQNLEIIVVNDGSTDQTLSKINDFAKKDARIKIINQKNQGLSEARNNGIKKATGKYIALIDGDDEIAPDFIKKLYFALTKTDSDIAVCGYRIISKHAQRSFSPISNQTTGPNAAVRLLTKQQNYDVIVCNKLYKRELFKYINYPPRQIHEDNLTTYKLYATAKYVCSIDDPLYYYHKHPGSITTTTNKEQSLSVGQQAASEAIEYFSSLSNLDPQTQKIIKYFRALTRLQQAANVALLLSQFAFLDHALRHEISALFIPRSIQNIKKHADLKNPLLSKRLRVYLLFVQSPHAILYKIYRIIKPSSKVFLSL